MSGAVEAPLVSGPQPLVEYLIARQGVPARRGLAYDYVVAGDGVFLAAENELLSVRVPVARARLRGLSPAYAECSLKHGRLRFQLWEQILAVARDLGAAGNEVLVAIEHDTRTGYRLCLPRQVVGPTHVTYVPGSDGAVVLELHSHHRYPARFSATDDADEQRLCLYGVVGRLNDARPHVALRAGAYGHFLPVPWETVFAGGPAACAAIWDSYYDLAAGDRDDPQCRNGEADGGSKAEEATYGDEELELAGDANEASGNGAP